MKYLLLLIPCVIALAVPLFNSDAPELFGMPFFYWFQLLLVPLSSARDLRCRSRRQGLTMFDHLNVVAASVFVFFFAVVTILGFLASRWKAGDLGHISNGGSADGSSAPWITWFLLGGDLYTAYTVIAIPAVVYAIGAYGFFAVPYTILIYPRPLSDHAASLGGIA